MFNNIRKYKPRIAGCSFTSAPKNRSSVNRLSMPFIPGADPWATCFPSTVRRALLPSLSNLTSCHRPSDTFTELTLIIPSPEPNSKRY